MHGENSQSEERATLLNPSEMSMSHHALEIDQVAAHQVLQDVPSGNKGGVVCCACMALGLASAGSYNQVSRSWTSGGADVLLACVLQDPTCVRFLAVGDFGCSKHDQRRHPWSQFDVANGMASVANSLDPQFVAGVGDLIYDFGARSSEQINDLWQKPFIEGKPSLQKPWHLILGNHDWRSDPAQFEEQFDKCYLNAGFWDFPHYFYKKSYRGGNATVDLFFIDTMIWLWAAHDSRHMMNGRGGDFASPRRKPWHEPRYEEQVSWLRRELMKSTADWKIVLGHHPIYTTGAHSGNMVEGYFPDKSMANLDEIMRNGGATIYINGHNHNQEVFQHQGVTYITTGNGCKAYHSKWGCARNYGPLSLPEHTSRSDSKLFDCGGGFAGLSFPSAYSANLVMFDKTGETLPGGYFELKNRLHEVASEGVPSIARRVLATTTGRGRTCYQRKLTMVDMECPDSTCDTHGCCRVIPELTSNESCKDYCAWHDLMCVQTSLSESETECHAIPAAQLECEHRNNMSTSSLICTCAPLQPELV